MATWCLRVSLFPLLKKAPLTVTPAFGKRKRRTRFHCCCSSPQSWQPSRKKKVVMRVAYVGTNYRGLQMQRDEHSLSTIKKELETAIFKAGGICESNFGDLQKIRWARNSRTDKGVHFLATIISFKMEILKNAWNGDPYGFVLANYVNSYLPGDIKVFSILPSQRSFDPWKDCILRKYSYLFPAEIIGIQSHSSNDELDYHIPEFNDILNVLRGNILSIIIRLGPSTGNIFLIGSQHKKVAHQQERVCHHMNLNANTAMGKKILKLMRHLLKI
ncbi:putative tRNA pseudouridine synthase [Spatholobus suberectus]|nr:putative tRNA pseudouridine synthase [Spatholobus suberectus]